MDDGREPSVIQGREARERKKPTGAAGAEGETIVARHPLARSAAGLPLRPFTLGLALVALVGCGNDGDEDVPRPDDQPPDAPSGIDPTGDDRPGLLVAGLDGRSAEAVTSPWLVNAFLFRNASATPATGQATVALLRYEDDFPIARHVDFFAGELDTCELRREDGGSDGDGDEGSPPLTISGGTAVTINTPSSPWLVLERRTLDDGTGVDYERAFGEWPGQLPDGATLSIPGDAFPGVAAYPLGEPAAPIRLLPDENEPPGADTVYTWVPGEGRDYIEIAFIAVEPDGGELIDFPLVCTVVDDGRFELPEDARAFVATTPDTLELRYERAREIVELADGIVFRTLTKVAE